MRHGGGTWMSPQIFVWRRTSAIKDRYELRAGDECLGRLTLGGLLLPTARVEAGGFELDLAVGGMANRQVSIAEAQSERVMAAFERRWSGRKGVLRFADGGQLEWRRTGWWRAGYEFTDRFSNPVVRFHLDGTVEGGDLEVNDYSAGSTIWRYDPDAGQYIFNLKTGTTSPWDVGTWRTTVSYKGITLASATITKENVELHGGSARITSPGPGFGTTVTVGGRFKSSTSRAAINTWRTTARR